MDEAPFFETFDHTADFGVRVFGENPAQLFENAARTVTLLLTDPDGLQEQEERDISIPGWNLTGLLVDWLREILYMANGEGLFTVRALVRDISPAGLRARVWLDPGPREMIQELKAVTWHQAAVEEVDGKWTGTVIFDV